MKFPSINDKYEWNGGDTLDDFYIDPCLAQIKSLAVRFTLGMMLGIFGLTAYLIIAVNPRTAWYGFTSLIIVGFFFTLPVYVALWNRASKLKSRRFLWRIGTVVYKYRGQRGKARVCVDERFNECFPYAPLRNFNKGETVLVVRFSDKFGRYAFTLQNH